MTICLLVILMSSVGCKGSMDNYYISEAMDNLEKISSYEGVILEKGLMESGDIKTRVVFSRDGFLYAEVLAPKAFRGDVFLNNGSDMFIYYAASRFGIRIRGFYTVINDSAEKWRKRTRERLEKSAAENEIDWRGSVQVAKRKAYYFTIDPLKKGDYRLAEKLWSDADYSFPLKLEMYKDNKLFYAFHFESIVYNKKQSIERDYSFPGGTVVATWDMTSKGYSISAIKKGLNFKLKVPCSLPKRMVLKKIVRAKGVIPAACLIYCSDIHYILLSEVRDYGIIKIRPKGIVIPSIDTTARLLLLGDISTITWKDRGVSLTLTGTLPYQEMIDIAKNVK